MSALAADGNMSETGWRLIESAPRDGTPVLLWLPTPIDSNDVVTWTPAIPMHVCIGWWSGSTWRDESPWESCFGYEGAADSAGCAPTLPLKVRPTHWMPLSSPPANDPRR